MKKSLSLLLAFLFLLGCSSPSEAGQVSVSEPTEPAVPSPTEDVLIEEAITLVTEAPTPVSAPEPTSAPTPVPTPEPTPVPTPEPTPAPFVPCALPDTLRVRRGFSETGLLGVLRRDSDGSLFACGTVGDSEPAFFPCDENGAVALGEQPTETVCMVPLYTPTDRAKENGLLKLVVYLPTQSVVAFRAEDGEWIEERVMICSTGRPGVITPLGDYRIYETYEFKRLGTEGNYCCGLYACRFNGAYLFHSVPISYDAIDDPALGHRMMYMHKYEQLGSGASDGCVRLTVADAKWIYDNAQIPYQTAVLITDREGPVPPAAPAVLWEAPYTDENGFGWDPTDPDPENPYQKLYADPTVPLPTASPVPPEPFSALALPDNVRVRNGCTRSNLPGVVRRNADGAFFAYGSVGETEPCFYPCDETGAVALGASPVPQSFVVPAYTPTEPPKKDGEKLLVVYLGSQCVVGYEGQDGDWNELRVMICSTGRRNHDTPVGSYRITDRYSYHALGTGDTSCYGFWACRFKDHYLFHSVPISLDAGRDTDKGHRMCNMHKYEKLGSVASDGCVRLTVADAKWIYDLSANERVNVRVVKEKGPTPTKPPEIIWEEPYTDKNGFGWDPTDPDPENPYLALQQP